MLHESCGKIEFKKSNEQYSGGEISSFDVQHSATKIVLRLRFDFSVGIQSIGHSLCLKSPNGKTSQSIALQHDIMTFPMVLISAASLETSKESVSVFLLR